MIPYLLLAAAVLVGVPHRDGSRRLAWLRAPDKPPKPKRVRSRDGPDTTLAVSWDLLAACLRSGMPVPTAVRAVAADMAERPGRALRGVADLLALGEDPVRAWASALDCPETAALARGARRTARSGAALAGVAAGLARDARDQVRDTAEAAAQRVAVWVCAPLTLCFLPAFLCLGIAPVVLGLVGTLSNEL